MKERPILFSGPMVRAILEGRKTQTRRVVKPQPVFRAGAFELIHKGQEVALLPDELVDVCSRFQPGDHLWVKETFRYWEDMFCYRADGAIETTKRPWKPSIFMPRTASRITLEITSVRVERLKDINRDDALSEGLGFQNHCWRDEWIKLWDSINAKRNNGIYAWAKNPFVWVIIFRQISRSLNQGADA